MAEVTGPISSLPGSSHAAPAGAMCDDHADRPAVTRIQGETDSFGSEMYDLCVECLAQHRLVLDVERNQPRHCDWCKKNKLNVRAQRDWEEGMHGPVYQVCADCRSNYNEQLRKEMDDCYE